MTEVAERKGRKKYVATTEKEENDNVKRDYGQKRSGHR